MTVSIEHHYGVMIPTSSTPKWSVGALHHFGAEEGMTSPNNIQHFREAKGWSRPQLGERMGTSGQQIERLEKAQRKLSQEWIDKAAAALGVAPYQIIMPVEPLPKNATALQIVESDLLPTRNSEEGSIPLRRLDFRLSMGDGTNLDDYFEEGVFEFDAALLRTISRSPPQSLIVGDGIGDSMTPTITDSSLVIIDTNQRMLNAHDAIWAIALFGAGGIKRLRPVARDRVLVISDNPALENQEVSTEDLRILGRVIWSARRH